MISPSKLSEMDEATLRTQVLIPLFRKMGFQDVFHYHGGPGEKGKDIVMWKQDTIRGRVNYGVVVKSQRISGKTTGNSSAAEVRFQIEQCFASTYADPVTTEPQRITRCFVVSSHEIKKEAMDAIQGILAQNNLNKVTDFISGDKLVELIEKHLPEATILEKFQAIQKILDDANPHYRILANPEQNGLKISLIPKYPGAEHEHPIDFSLKFDLPDTFKGEELRKKFEQHLATGEAITITRPYLRHFNFPEFIESALQISSKNIDSITVKKKPQQKSLVVKFEATSRDGEKTELEYVELEAVQIGNEEITLNNFHQPVPWKIKLVLNNKKRQTFFQYTVEIGGHNVNRVLQGLSFLAGLSEGCSFQITHLDSGLRLQNAVIEPGIYPAPEEGLLNLLKAINHIQQKSSITIDIPKRDLTKEELKNISQTVQKMKTGEMKLNVKNWTIETDKESAKHLLKNHEEAGPSPLSLHVEEEVELLGSKIPMGKVTIICRQAYIDKEDIERLREQLKRSNQEHASIRFKPWKGQAVVAHYHKWAPK